MSTKKKVTTLYSKRAYKRDINIGKRQYNEALAMLNHNLTLIKVGRDLLVNNTTVDKEKYDFFVEVLGHLVDNTDTTTKALEGLKLVLDNPPEHKPRTDIDVTEWLLNIQNTILTALGWIPEVSPVYLQLLEELGPETKETTEEAVVEEQ